MDNKNLIAALSLSLAILILWSIFFEAPKPVNKDSSQISNKEKNENKITPNINETLKIKKLLERSP